MSNTVFIYATKDGSHEKKMENWQVRQEKNFRLRRFRFDLLVKSPRNMKCIINLMLQILGGSVW